MQGGRPVGARLFPGRSRAVDARGPAEAGGARAIRLFSPASWGVAGALGGQRGKRTLRDADFLIFNQQFNTLIKAGLPILKALDLLAERAASPRLRPLLLEVRDRVREGASLSEALEKEGIFPKVYVTSVLAGEKSGNLTGVLDYYIAYQRVATGVSKKLIATLIYPVILVTVATAIVTYLVTYVVPQFAKLYADMNVQLPAVTRVLLDRHGERSSLRIGIRRAARCVASSRLIFWSRTEQGGVGLDRVKLKLPVVGDTWIKFQVAQFCRTLSTLLAGGTPLVAALTTAAESVRSPLIASGITRAAQLVREGQSLHVALAGTGLMPAMGLEMIEVGEASGALSPMLGSVAEFYEEETNQRIATLIAVVEPAILVFMADCDSLHFDFALSADLLLLGGFRTRLAGDRQSKWVHYGNQRTTT